MIIFNSIQMSFNSQYVVPNRVTINDVLNTNDAKRMMVKPNVINLQKLN